MKPVFRLKLPLFSISLSFDLLHWSRHLQGVPCESVYKNLFFNTLLITTEFGSHACIKGLDMDVFLSPENSQYCSFV